jgi:hypothetical protein
MHIYCKTEYAVLLVGIPDEKKVLRFPNNGKQWPGIVFKPVALQPINEQLVGSLKEYLDLDVDPTIEVNQEYSDITEDKCTIYLATGSSDKFSASESWQNMPELLRGMDRNRKRLPFLRAWQVLTGSLGLNTNAVENADLDSLLD